jgi:Secretion system C-terminal sorting domain
MRKKLQTVVFLLGVTLFTHVKTTAQSNQNLDRCPNLSEASPNQMQAKALWDIHFDYNATANTSGDVGMAAACYFNSEYWISRWATDTMYRLNSAGVLVSEFTIAGITGVRSLTTDGTYLYAGINDGMIYRINPTTSLLAPPHITVSGSVTQVRFCTYDSTLNSGAGGFWIGNFSTAIEAVDMSGNVLTTIAAATHTLTGMYGAAVDNYTAGGPYLWVFDQSGTSFTQIIQLQLPAGTPTAVTRDVYADFSGANSLTSGLAGGLFVSNQIVPGEITLGGMVQGTPNNVLFGYEIGTFSPAGVSESEMNSLKVYPNPSNGIVTIANDGIENAEYSVVDVNGKVLLTGILQGDLMNIDISSLANGNYILEIFSNGRRMGERVIVKN